MPAIPPLSLPNTTMISIPRSQRSAVREKQVKQEAGGHFMPVILVTAKSLPRHRRRSRGQKSPCSINASSSPRQSGKLFKTVMRYLRELPGIPRIAGESALRCEIEKGSRIIALPGEERTIRGYSGVLHLRGVKSQHPACSQSRSRNSAQDDSGVSA
jgi:hypothetical protein